MAKMHRAHKIALDPTNVQRTKLSKAAGVSRFAYNWALDHWNTQYAEWKNTPEEERGHSPSWYSVRRDLNAIKREQFPWMLESTKCAPEGAIADLGVAFQNAFAGRAKFPKFKKKGRSAASFRATGFGPTGSFDIKGKRIRVPKIGWVRMREEFRWSDAKILSATFSERAGKWFVSIACEIPDENSTRPPAPDGTVVGVDLGVREYATSDSELIQVPRAYRESERQLRRAQQSLSRKTGPDRRAGQKASSNWKKQQRKVARLHMRTANVRADWLHKLTNDLSSRYAVIGIEDLNVKGMAKNRHLAKSVSDAGFGEFRRQIEYKTAERGGVVVVADRWYPSSKTCSACGTVKTTRLPLSVREWRCSDCGTEHHRDINAAMNLKNLAASSAVTACGEFSTSTQLDFGPAEQVASVKQEPASDMLKSGCMSTGERLALDSLVF